MLLKGVGIALILDGAMSAMVAAGSIDSFVYRNVRDQALVIAHFVVGALLALSGRQLVSASRSGLAIPAVVAALVVAALQATRFEWLGLVERAAYSAVVIAVLYKTTFPKT
jgi:hypothetical protein